MSARKVSETFKLQLSFFIFIAVAAMASDPSASSTDISSQSESDITLTPTTSDSEFEDQDQGQAETENVNDGEDDDDEEKPKVIHYNLFGWLKDELAEISNPGLPRTTSRDLHNAYWRTIFEELVEKCNADESIPNDIFTPAHHKVEVMFRSWPVEGHYCCPCDFDRDYAQPADLDLQLGEGESITKTVMLRELSRTLYGVDGEEGIGFGEESDRPVIDRVDYMRSSPDGSLMGELWVLCRGLDSRREPDGDGSGQEEESKWPGETTEPLAA